MNVWGFRVRPPSGDRAFFDRVDEEGLLLVEKSGNRAWVTLKLPSLDDSQLRNGRPSELLLSLGRRDGYTDTVFRPMLHLPESFRGRAELEKFHAR